MNQSTSDLQSIPESKRLELFNQCQKWFDSHGFIAHWDSLMFIEFHWRIYATIEDKNGKRKHMFFISASYLSQHMGLGKPNKDVMRIISKYNPNRIEEMRKAINQGN